MIFLLIVGLSFILGLYINFGVTKQLGRKVKTILNHNDGNTKDVAKYALLKLLIPGIDIPIFMIALMLYKHFHFDHPVIVYGGFIVSMLIIIIMTGIGIYYYLKERDYVYIYEQIRFHYNNNILEMKQAIQNSTPKIQRADKRMTELNKTIFLQSVLQSLISIVFILNL